MSKTIISVENLSKKYLIGEKQNFYTLRDTISGAFSFNKKKNEEYWALKDINFEIKQGESVGIIGRNGAGKSTLLKILSQITPPTTGKITMKGRVASLLEVGTGFHQELTGRENIFLNGAILGMSREEVKRKYDEIVAFSEVEKFLDTPVKHYSSGMYMRLAFSVAAHLESEILIVDEVLAVGDSQFQKKCLGKMDEVANKQGRTVIFVSHNMDAIKNICTHGLLLSNGTIASDSKIDEVINKYQNLGGGSNYYKNLNHNKGDNYISYVKIKNFEGEVVGDVSCDDGIVIEIGYHVCSKIEKALLCLNAYKNGDLYFLSTDTDSEVEQLRDFESGDFVCEMKIKSGTFLPGYYNFDISIQKPFVEYISRVQGLGINVYGDDSPKNKIWKNKVKVACKPNIGFIVKKRK